jgi:hypothetical protein
LLSEEELMLDAMLVTVPLIIPLFDPFAEAEYKTLGDNESCVYWKNDGSILNLSPLGRPCPPTFSGVSFSGLVLFKATEFLMKTSLEGALTICLWFCCKLAFT